MPSSAGVAVLEDMRREQVSLAARSMRLAILAWPLLQQDESRWLAVMLRLIRRDRLLSAQITRRYMMAYRVVERVPGTFDPALPGDINEEQILTSLRVTGPIAVLKALERVNPLEEQAPGQTRLPLPLPRRELEKLMAFNARAVQRHVTNGGREVVDDVLRRDPARNGYMRLTDGDPCYFCAMLASRGPVYEEDSFDDSDPRFQGAGEHKVHDGCGCTLVPIYGSGAGALSEYKRYEREWQQALRKQAEVGGDIRKIFRQLHEGREVRR